MKLLPLLLIAFAAVASASTGLLLPLYKYPTTASGIDDWTAALSAMDAHPSLPFHIIINENNGAPYPSPLPANIKDWAQLLGHLHSKSKTTLIGYIATSSSARPLDDVKRGIDQYAAWSTHEGWEEPPVQHNIKIDGVFLDEIDTDPSKLKYNQEITKYAKKVFPSGTVILNPGSAVQKGSESLLDLADSVVAIETCYTKVEGARCPEGGYTPFEASSLDELVNPGKSSVLVHEFYEAAEPFRAASMSTLEDTVKAIVGKGVHSFYVATFGYTGDFLSGPANVTTVARLAAQA
ncbi:Spherulation-specific family 4 [Podospora aff. communis PSN243]|uniref:Spherulation-specific family 4 n=1 Tax=Podospora aff. communis PSN243 TaxID=3040156 RepID=A0AAV9GA24_9PEZI|nr:Spherulation-specific family 4 [Podospora aff. communis PSN243]